MRRTIEVTIPEEPKTRDSGKTYIITEMAAAQAERWANRAILAVGKSGATIGNYEGSGIAGIAVLGFRALFGIQEGTALELMDEMMACVKRRETALPDGRPLVESDIEEVATRWHLKQEVFALHTGFSLAEIKSTLTSAAQTAAASISANTRRTSPKQSVKPSRRGRRR